MRIHRLSYTNRRLGWSLEPVDFSNLTLLVGASGVGKTRILRALVELKRIAGGRAVQGVSWDLVFTGNDAVRYRWSGEYESLVEQPSVSIIYDEDEFEEAAEEGKVKPRILRETLSAGEQPVIERDLDQLKLRGVKTPRLDPSQSALHLLREEEGVASASKSFGRIVYSDHTDSTNTPNSLHYFELGKLRKRYPDLESIRESTLTTMVKLVLCAAVAPETFQQIASRFKEIFPYVDGLKLEPRDGDEVPSFMREIPVLQLRERGVSEWIDQRNISSGMFRTVMHLAEMFLSPEGTVVLIDEFENSLGVNCIDVITEDLLDESRRIQFIVTSHHPYVINNIGVQHWKIVTRQGPLVTTRDASDFRIGSSSHDAFLQLINLDEYKDGIAAP